MWERRCSRGELWEGVLFSKGAACLAWAAAEILAVCPGRLLGQEEEMVWICALQRTWHFLFGVRLLSSTLCETYSLGTPPCNQMQNSLRSLVLPRIEKHVGKESQFPTQQMHHPRCPVEVPIPLWETLRKLLQIFLCISSLSDWTLPFREHWQSIRLKKTGKWSRSGCMNPHDEDTVQNDLSLLHILARAGFLVYLWIKLK